MQTVAKMWYEIYQNNQKIHSSTIIYVSDISSLPKVFNGSVGISSGTQVIYKEVLPNKRTKAIKRITVVDKQAMEAKANEIDALLKEYGAFVNVRNDKYAAHIINISPQKFTTITEEEVEILMNIQYLTYKLK